MVYGYAKSLFSYPCLGQNLSSTPVLTPILLTVPVSDRGSVKLIPIKRKPRLSQSYAGDSDWSQIRSSEGVG